MKKSETESRLSVAVDELRWDCDDSTLGFETTEEIEPLKGVVGQDEALGALRFGLEIFAPGQNIYVRGLTGTGRLSLLSRLLKEIQPACPLACDYAYVANFEAPEEPRLLELPRGRGVEFRDAIDRFTEFLAQDLADAMDSDALRQRKHFIDERFEEEAKQVAEPFERELEENGLTMMSATVGNAVRPVLLPFIKDEAAPPERIQQLKASGELSDEDIEELDAKISTFAKKLESISSEMQKIHARRVRRSARFASSSPERRSGSFSTT